jgi:hypothetical protein
MEPLWLCHSGTAVSGSAPAVFLNLMVMLLVAPFAMIGSGSG